MTDLEMGIICFVNQYHRNIAYYYEKYQMLHGVKYRREMDAEHTKAIRDNYKANCFEAAYELKTYYAENGMLSNTIVLKTRSEKADMEEMMLIKIYSDLDGKDYEYTHHAIEVFKEHGRYKVLDILHSDKPCRLEAYLDAVCHTNHCRREQLRYDMGYLAPCHVFADNMQELSDVLRYLDREYGVGKPRMNLINVRQDEGSCLLSDDMVMDFSEFGRKIAADYKTVCSVWNKVYAGLMGIRMNLLHTLCMGHVMKDSIIILAVKETLLDDAKICEVMDDMPHNF